MFSLFHVDKTVKTKKQNKTVKTKNIVTDGQGHVLSIR